MFHLSNLSVKGSSDMTCFFILSKLAKGQRCLRSHKSGLTFLPYLPRHFRFTWLFLLPNTDLFVSPGTLFQFLLSLTRSEHWSLFWFSLPQPYATSQLGYILHLPRIEATSNRFTLWISFPYLHCYLLGKEYISTVTHLPALPYSVIALVFFGALYKRQSFVLSRNRRKKIAYEKIQ